MGAIRPLSNGCDLFRIALFVVLAGCGAGDTRLDPGDLELRDLLGVAPDTAVAWDADQREAARRVLDAGLAETGAPVELTLATGGSADERVARTLVLHDAERADAGDGALGVVRFDVTGDRAIARPIAARTAAAPQLEVWLSERWTGDLPARGLDRLAALASDAGHATGPVVVSPGPRLAVIASYVGSMNGAPARLIVNPVWLAALEPVEGGGAQPPAVSDVPGAQPPTQVAVRRTTPDPGVELPRADPTIAHAANPYSFYGTVAECAAAQRTRCESCVGTGTCEAITRGSDGDTECQALGAGDGRGYFLICINLALAISSVDVCTADAAPGCTRDTNAANELNELENNASFLDDATCGGALDGCLTEVYGPPDGEFPGLDGGVSPPRPPRSTNVSCGESCDNDNNCEANPSCGNGPSCNNSFSCDSACSSSNDQSGCGGNCNACTEDEGDTGGSSGCGGDDSGGDGGGGCGGDGDSGGNGEGCSSDSSSSSSGCDSGCGGSSSGGGDSCGGGDSGGGGCGGGDSGGGGCGGDSGGGGCGGDSGGGGCGGGGGGSSNSCNAARRDSSGTTALAVSIMWGVLPIPAAAWIRRRARRRGAEVQR